MQRRCFFVFIKSGNKLFYTFGVLAVFAAEGFDILAAADELGAEQLLGNGIVKPDDLLSRADAGLGPDLKSFTALGDGERLEALEKAHKAPPLFFVRELGDYLNESVNIVKVLVDRSKADISHGVQLFEAGQHSVADLAGSGLGLHGVGIGVLDILHQLIHLLNADGALLDSGLQTLEELGLIEGFEAAVLLIHHEQRLLNYLIGGEALAAVGTLASPALLAFAGARIYNLCILKIAKRTSHNYSP